MSVSNALVFSQPGPAPSTGTNPISGVSATPTANFVYYKLVNNGTYYIKLASNLKLNKLYYAMVGCGGLGGQKCNSNTPTYGSCGGGGGGGVVIPIDALNYKANPPIDISNITSLSATLYAKPGDVGTSNINYLDSSSNNITISAPCGKNGYTGNVGPTGGPGAPGAAGGNGGAGGTQYGISGPFGSAGGGGGYGAEGQPNPIVLGPPGKPGPSVSPGTSTGTSEGSVQIFFADSTSTYTGKSGAGGNNSSDPKNSALGNGSGAAPGYILLYYNVNDVVIL